MMTPDQNGTRRAQPHDPEQGRAFRNVMGRFPTGVAIVTAVCEGEPTGMAVNSFTSVSLQPPLVLFCAAHSSTTWPKIELAGYFAVNLMPRRSASIVRRFAERGVDRFDGVTFSRGVTGAPLLDAAAAYLECKLASIHDEGDHFIAVGSVVDLEEREPEPPLVFYGSEYVGITTGGRCDPPT